MSGEEKMEMLEKILMYKEMIKDLYVNNKDPIIVALCIILALSWIL